MATQLWANRDPSWKSTDSSESSETYLNLNQLCRNYSISSSYSQDQCLKGHNLILVPVTCERNTICGTCCAYIKIKPVQILCYHCEECNLDSCSQCSEIAFTDHNGSGLYKGQLSPNEKRQGHGRMEWTSESSPLRGSVYEGAWKNDMRDGHGKYVYLDGGSYEGLWVDDVKCGYGRRCFSNGFKYHGAFKNGLKHGKGIFKGVTGRWCFAVWENDQMVGPGRFPLKPKASQSVLDD